MFPNGPTSATDLLLQNYQEDPFGLLARCFKEYGDIFSLPLGTRGNESLGANGRWVFLTRPEHIKQLFTESPDVVEAGKANWILFGHLLPPQGSLGIDGEEHLERRRLILKPLQGDRMKIYTDTIRELTSQMVSAWDERTPFSLFHHMQRITIETIIKTVFGLADDRQAKHVCSRLMKVEQAETSPEEQNAIMAEVSGFLSETIRQNRRDGIEESRDDVFSILLRSKDRQGRELSEAQLHDELITLLIAGFGTTATMLCWAFECFLSFPGAALKVKEELRVVLAGRPVEAGSIGSLEYLDAFIKEVFRFRPMIPSAGVRLLSRPIHLDGYDLPAGTMIANCPSILHMRPEIYPQPEAFKPERFLGVKIDPYRWTPFGGGVRRCVGMFFALHEMKVVLATVTGMVDLALAQPVTKGVLQGPFYVPEGGPLVQIQRRRTPS